MSGAVRAQLGDGRWHFQHGPIDLIIGVEGEAAALHAALESAWARFARVLDELVRELPLLRTPCPPAPCSVVPRGPIARRMFDACQPYAGRFGLFVTPMAAVAGSVAQEIAASFARPGIRRAWIDNGGDVALWLAGGASVDVGMVTDLAAPEIAGRLRIAEADTPRGIATSGWRGRSFSLGVADAVTVLADTAAMADAAATMIANAIDVEHPAVQRAPASSLRDDSDLGERAVTVAVGALPADAVELALARGERFARRCIELGLVSQTMLSLQGRSRIVLDHHIEALA
ncbi:MAG: UPF0280 family protein [Burkholderiales bacterium]|nr:UPF0280 family protein [Burkholderiales bacterium]